MPNRRLRDVLSDHPIVRLALTDTVRTAAEAMAEHHIGSVLVVEDDRLAGIFTERDVIERVVAKGLDPEALTLAEVMTPDPVSVTDGATVMRALHAMRDGGLRHLPVTDDQAHVVGIVSMRDFVDDEVKSYDHEMEFRQTLTERIG
ncbi:MAG: CBS domain-containing protein [Rhodospirillum sp.]|nr:CBS domain-containing protein [Rhodospirillum sp.]MCF8490259.1 CBS domain-containing protein [Rhodospirillum sp.]MCF8499370.1 CBS domain-containing protein [Rhodospirillum sp.]